MKDNMKNKLVVITGASRGIGRETAYLFAQEHCKLVITYLKGKGETKKTGKKCKELGAADVLILNLDVTKNKSIISATKAVLKKFGKIDILINNAGVVVWQPLMKQSFTAIENQLQTNLDGLIKLTRLCLPHITNAIINVSSGAGKTGYATLTTYCATKFGVRGFTQALADECRKLKIFSVNPGMTATRMTNFRGVSPVKVARIILNAAKGKYKVRSGGDIDVWKFL